MSTFGQKTQSHGPDVELSAGLREPQAHLPAVIEDASPPQETEGASFDRRCVIADRRRSRRRLVLVAAASALPPGIAFRNGRLEADEIDIDTKFAGRVARLFVDEGDMVKAGQVVAMMDTRDLEASLKKAEAGEPGAARARRGEGEPISYRSRRLSSIAAPGLLWRDPNS